jgi:uncharacterized membrane protein
MLLWALIATAALTMAVVGGAWVVREQDAEPPSALERAQERYVRGEIDHAELERLLDNVLRADQRSTDDS